MATINFLIKSVFVKKIYAVIYSFRCTFLCSKFL